MFEKIRIIFTIPELRQKIFLTLILLAVYRVGYNIPMPMVDAFKMRAAFQADDNQLGAIFKQVAVFSASQLSQATVFGLGIMPYISASIIFQLLASVWPPLEQLQKEGEAGRKKINEYTRYATVVICILQSWVYVKMLAGGGDPQSRFIREEFMNGDSMALGWHFAAVIIMTAGTLFLMWLGEQIDEYGLGNGISLIIMAGILADMPQAALQLFRPIWEKGLSLGGDSGTLGVETLLLLAFLFVAIVAGVVFITQGQRRIVTQSAKHVRGTKVYGGTRQYLPLRVNQAGVMPIIFASSLLLFPAMAFQGLGSRENASPIWRSLADTFQRGTSFWYNVMYVALIFFFCYFWTAITFNPKDMANNLRDFGTFIPGYRPGKPTEEYLEKVMMRITYVGAAFLAAVAIGPTILSGLIPGADFTVSRFYGGTGLLIGVSVAFDLVQKIDSHLVMRNYKGLLEKSPLS